LTADAGIRHARAAYRPEVLSIIKRELVLDTAV
jgi:hypothetical protein